MPSQRKPRRPWPSVTQATYELYTMAFDPGYNPKMELTRTQTIMKGAPYCDFRYRLKSDKE